MGVTVTINTITADEWYSKVYKEHDFQATLQEHVNTRDVVWYGNPTFYWGYNNEAVTALVDEAEQAPPRTSRPRSCAPPTNRSRRMRPAPGSTSTRRSSSRVRTCRATA